MLRAGLLLLLELGEGGLTQDSGYWAVVTRQWLLVCFNYGGKLSDFTLLAGYWSLVTGLF